MVSGSRSRAGRYVIVVAFGVLGVAACGADYPDAYSDPAEAAAPTTARTIPPTTVSEPPAVEPADADDTSAASTAVQSVVPPGPEPVEPNGEVVQVRSLDNSFRLADIEVVAGTEVWWTNNGRNDHNVLPVDDTLDWGIDTADFTPGDEYRRVFGVPGTYLYYCSIHGTTTVGMVGSVTVVPASG